MPYLKPIETDHLPLPGNPDYWVEMKSRGSWGDRRKVEDAVIGMAVQLDAAGQGSMGLDAKELSAGTVALLRTMVTAWNLDDAEGNLLPINESSVELLDAADVKWISDEAATRLNRRSEGEDVPFVGQSAVPSTGTTSKTPSPSAD